MLSQTPGPKFAKKKKFVHILDSQHRSTGQWNPQMETRDDGKESGWKS